MGLTCLLSPPLSPSLIFFLTGTHTCGFDSTVWWAFYLTRFVDALIYLFLPQICITAQRLWQGRPLLHRMTARTVVIGDCPWVAQSAEALLSKLFACSYSAAGIGVISGNPADHLVHRHTHRVVRGALMVCGRPDGRLSALTSLEATVCLSVNQASSIPSIGSTLESITIGHNPSTMPLTAKNIFLDRNRPLFLCEKLLTEKEGVHPEELKMSSGALLGAYSNLRLDSEEKLEEGLQEDVFALMAKFGFSKTEEESEMQKFREVFDSIDEDGGGSLDIEEFTLGFQKVNPDMTDEQSVKTLERIPGVSVNSVADIASIAWDELFQQFLQLTAADHVDEKSNPGAQYVFVDPKSQHLLALIERLAVTKAAVLLQGQTGTGKEIVARTLHALSDRASAPFVALNCAAMPEHLVEDMLFGHEKGAFTGAARELQGIFEQAKNGTVFLDEIGEMPVQLQAKLLRVLQEKEVVRLGGRDPIALDFRLIAATNKDLKAGIADKTFREDLYYRISAFKLQIPSLMDRKGDILPLANTLAARHGLEHPEFTEAALRQLYRYSWPGNVRELDNVIQRAVVFANYGRIDEQHIFFDEPLIREEQSMTQQMLGQDFYASRLGSTPMAPAMPSRHRDLQSAVRESEYDVIMDAINSTRTREDAARKLGISPRTLRYKMAKLRESRVGMSHCA